MPMTMLTLNNLLLASAVIGGTLFLFRIVMQVFGAGDHGDLDASADIDLSDGDIGHGTVSSFQLLSLQGISSFLMMFGLVGLALYEQSGLPAFLAVPGALAAGLGSVWIVGKIFVYMMRLQSSGNLDPSSAAGQEGIVYLTVPPEGKGKVQINIQNRQREYEAISDRKEELKTGARVRVVRVINGNVMVVERVG